MSSPLMNVMQPLFGAPSPEDVLLETIHFQVTSKMTQTAQDTEYICSCENNSASNSNGSAHKRARFIDDPQQCIKIKCVDNTYSTLQQYEQQQEEEQEEEQQEEEEHYLEKEEDSDLSTKVEMKEVEMRNLLEYANSLHCEPWNVLLGQYLIKEQVSDNTLRSVNNYCINNARKEEKEELKLTFASLSVYEQVEFAHSALRHALSVIARLVHADTLGCFTITKSPLLLSSSSPIPSSSELLVKSENKQSVKQSHELETQKALLGQMECHSGNNNNNNNNNESSNNVDQDNVRNLLTLYCKLQALELELNDIVRHTKEEHRRCINRNQYSLSTSNDNMSSKTDSHTNINIILSVIESCVNALEMTILDIILWLPTKNMLSALTNTTTTTTTTTTTEAISTTFEKTNMASLVSFIQQVQLPEFEYFFRTMLEALPDVCCTLNWPCQLAHLGKANADQMANDNNNNKMMKMVTKCDDLYNAITAIVLESMLQLKQYDCNSLLQKATYNNNVSNNDMKVSSSSVQPQREELNQEPQLSISVLAALQLSRERNAHHALPEEEFAFNELVAKAWRGGYNRAGVRIAMLEMRITFYKQYRVLLDELQNKIRNSSSRSCTLQNTSSIVINGNNNKSNRHKEKKEHTSTTTKTIINNVNEKLCVAEVLEKFHQLQELELCWKHILKQNYSKYINKIYWHEGYEQLESSWLLSENNIFDILSLHNATLVGPTTLGNVSLSQAQERCLRVVERLREIDTNGWFAIPAFDLVNIDFTSVETWIRSKSFAIKSHRAAFEALRIVLERMVDSCVARYGPTHEFSLLITTVRQEFVDIARQEKLL